MASESQILASRQGIMEPGHQSQDTGHGSRVTGHERRATSHEPRETSDERRETINMQNKANLLDAQMNVSSVLTKDYENVPLRRRGQNKPKTNPISEKPK